VGRYIHPHDEHGEKAHAVHWDGGEDGDDACSGDGDDEGGQHDCDHHTWFVMTVAAPRGEGTFAEGPAENYHWDWNMRNNETQAVPKPERMLHRHWACRHHWSSSNLSMP
jgi:hypothetical protein